jgi:hypothetical protein
MAFATPYGGKENFTTEAQRKRRRGSFTKREKSFFKTGTKDTKKKNEIISSSLKI